MLMWFGIVVLLLMSFPDEMRTLVDSVIRGDVSLLVLAGLVLIVIFQRA